MEDLIIAKDRIFRQIKNRFVVNDFIILIIINFYHTLSGEVKFFDMLVVTDDFIPLRKNSSIARDDQLICKSSLTLFKEVVKVSFEFSKHPCVLDDFSLHLRSKLLIEVKFFSNSIEIKHESLLGISSYVIV